MSARSPGNPLWDKLRRHVVTPGSSDSRRSRRDEREFRRRDSELYRDDYRDRYDERERRDRREDDRATSRMGGETYGRSPSGRRARSPAMEEERRRGAGGRDRERSRSPLGAGGYARGRRYEESSEYGSVDAGDVARRRLSSSKSFGVRGEAEQFDAAYYKTRIARLEEKVAKEHQKVKATVKYYEEQFEEQAKKIREKEKEENKATKEENAKLTSQVEWLKQAQESLKSERSAREELEKELKTLRERGPSAQDQQTAAERDKEITTLKATLEQARGEATLKEQLKEEVETLKLSLEAAKEEAAAAREDAEKVKSAPPRENDPTELLILQKQLDEEKAKCNIAEKKLATLKTDAIQPLEQELATVKAELERSKERDQQSIVVQTRLEIAEKLVQDLKAKAHRVDEMERYCADASKDKELLRQAYDKIQEITDKLISVTNEKEVLVRHSAQQAQVETQLEQTRNELTRIKNDVHSAHVDKSNTEMNFKYIVDDLSRALREHTMNAMRWEARMTSEINEASEEHAEIRRQTMNLVTTAEAEAQRVMRDSITIVNDARRMLQDNYRKSEDIIEDAIRHERHRMGDDTRKMKSELVEAERRAIKANEEIDALSEQLRQMRIELHLAKDAHAALAATQSAPSIGDTARDYGSDGPSSPSGEKAINLRRSLRIAQFQLLAMKARRRFEIDPTIEDLQEKLGYMREEREQILASRPAASFEDPAEVKAMQEEIEWSRAKIEKLEAEKAGSSHMTSSRENELQEALTRSRLDLEASEKTLKQLKKQQLDALEDVSENMEAHVRMKLTEMREEVMLANAQREKSRDAMNRAQDELIVVRSERDNALSNVKTMREENAEMREAISEMSVSRQEIMIAGREEVRARDDELHSVRKELSSVRSQKESTAVMLEDVKARLIDAEARVEEAEERRRELESELMNFSRDANERNRLEDRVIVLQTERDEKETKLEQAILSREELEEELKTLLSKLNESEEQVTSTVAQSRSEVFMANQTVSSLKIKLEEVEREYASANKAVERLTADRDVALSSLEETREALGKCEVELKLMFREVNMKEDERLQTLDAYNERQEALRSTQEALEKTEGELVNLLEVVEQSEESQQRVKVEVMSLTQDLNMTKTMLQDERNRSAEIEAERDVANDLLVETRRDLAEGQAKAQIRDSELMDLKIQRDRLAEEYAEAANTLKLTEAYLQNASAAVERHRAERDGLSATLETTNDTLSATESQLQTVSTQLAELYEEVEEYRARGDEDDAELVETRQALDAVIDKFKILRDTHEDALANMEEEVAARSREQAEHQQAIVKAKTEYEEHLRLLKRAVKSESDQGLLATELYAILNDVKLARVDTDVAGDETEERTAAQYSKRPPPPADKAAFEALTRIKKTLDSLKENLNEIGESKDIETEAVRHNLTLRILVFETFIDLISQRSRVGAYKGQIEQSSRLAPAGESGGRRGKPFSLNIGGIKLFG